MFECSARKERAVLVCLEGHSAHAAQEFRDLARSAGVIAVAVISAACPLPDPKYFLGKGKAQELHTSVQQEQADVVLVDHDLSPVQERNLEALLQCRVVGRTGLILDIFAQRARTFEGKLQVELAQLQYLSTRLVRGWSHLERQKGGIGLRGPGEKQLETDRRLITERIKHIDKRLQRVRKQRTQSRRSRRRASIPTVSLVGYTNAGKSTLFNALTQANVYTAGQLFATLDPTLRRLELERARPVVLADTVGFIRHLPHKLVAAFRATLEETRDAALLIHVIDVYDEDRRLRVAQVNEVLKEIGAHEVPQLEVYNKVDLIQDIRPHIERSLEGRVSRVWLSAASGAGVPLLRQALAEYFCQQTVRRRLRLPLTAGRLRARLFELGAIRREQVNEQGEWLLDVELERQSLEGLWHQEGLERGTYVVEAAPDDSVGRAKLWVS